MDQARSALSDFQRENAAHIEGPTRLLLGVCRWLRYGTLDSLF